MAYLAKTSTAGMWTNPVKVECTKCGARELYVQLSKVREFGGWECPICHAKYR
jgi:Zn finger protein HypA/HybF involved in hydrogenase expression